MIITLYRKRFFPDGQIVIVYDNDVHCAVDGYAKLVALRNQQERIAEYVTTVSCGDFANGGVVGASSKGELIVDIMNEVGYDVVTLGNHEFDYGTEQMFNLTDKLNANVVSSNFKNCQTDDHVFPAYHIVIMEMSMWHTSDLQRPRRVQR